MIQCSFTCKACGAKDVVFDVRIRRKDEDVVHWIEQAVRPALYLAHIKRSPLCASQHADLKIPMANEQTRIGDPQVH